MNFFLKHDQMILQRSDGSTRINKCVAIIKAVSLTKSSLQN